ncbi:hypothetical protein [Paraburkholderia caribensis]|uniref:hypothetical protein n=1 Tax=Paraburkholderia caribensis TaxID=75105 RepID=UPI0034D235F9
MSTTMRAKFMVQNVMESKGTKDDGNGPEEVKYSERLLMCAVGHNKAYEADGTGDEDSTFSRWTPCANLDITIQNPALWGEFRPGDKFYVDFTPAE